MCVGGWGGRGGGGGRGAGELAAGLAIFFEGLAGKVWRQAECCQMLI